MRIKRRKHGPLRSYFNSIFFMKHCSKIFNIVSKFRKHLSVFRKNDSKFHAILWVFCKSVLEFLPNVSVYRYNASKFHKRLSVFRKSASKFFAIVSVFVKVLHNFMIDRLEKSNSAKTYIFFNQITIHTIFTIISVTIMH